MTTNSHYGGKELDLFAKATNWKRYCSEFVSPYLDGRILEVGAGKGETTQVLANQSSSVDIWTCLEPDEGLFRELERKIEAGQLPRHFDAINGTIHRLGDQPRYDVILYIDVLEHIKEDRRECEKATSLLKENGRLIVLAPALPQLYSNFDRSIGHYRRYNKTDLKATMPDQLELEDIKYLDCAGILLSLGNKFILRRSIPTEKQISFWDTIVVPCSKILDQIVNYCVGKSIIGIWGK